MSFFFLSYRLWLISWIWILWMSRLHRSCVYTNRYIVLLLQRFCSTLPWQALGLVLMLKISADTSKHVRFYSLFRVVSDFSPLCLTKQAWRVAWKTPRVPRVNVSGTQHSRVLPIPPYSRCSEPSIHPRSIHASQKTPTFILVSKLSLQACFGVYILCLCGLYLFHSPCISAVNLACWAAWRLAITRFK